MVSQRNRILGTGIALLALFFPLFPAAGSHAQQDSSARSILADQLRTQTAGILEIRHHGPTGTVRFIGTEPGKHIKNPSPAAELRKASPEAAARAFLNVYGNLFGIKDHNAELSVMRSKEADRGRSFVRFQQRHQGIPVMAGEMIIQMDSAMDIVSTHGKTIPDISVDIHPVVGAASAREIAANAVLVWYEEDRQNLTSTEPELWIYNPVVFGINQNTSYLVWRMDVESSTKPVRELVLVEARSGNIVLHFNQVETALYRKIYDNNNTRSPGLPGYGPVREEGGGPTGIAHVDLAYDYIGDTYNFYLTNHDRDSIDGNGMMDVVATVRACPEPKENCPWFNAYWNGVQMAFGHGQTTDDIVGHEYTHGVTQYESGLYYYMQPGAINESFSDIWGEFVDLTNGKGNDSDEVRWLIGEDLGRPWRSMAHPPLYSQPDKMNH